MELTMAKPQVEMMPLGQLKPNKRNARTHSKKQIGQIADLVRQYGWTTPILVDEAGNIIAGHGRCQAAASLGLREIPVIVMSGLRETEKRCLALADNKVAANAGYDRAILAAELGELAALLPECDLSTTGFDATEIDALLGDFADPEQDPADELPEIGKEQVSHTGDMWLLGPHRLLCGDAKQSPDLCKRAVNAHR
jgi:ParB-like chromosome segregation protein Spo0J